ncbi:MAG: type II toxin-antitoxin system HicA family toxin [Euzebya sp.]
MAGRTYSGRQVLKGLRRAGFNEVSRRGSHVKLKNADGRTVIVPDHKEIARGTMRSVLRQAALSEAEFDRLAQ